MVKALEKQALSAELAAVDQILDSRSVEDDPIGVLAYKELKATLEERLRELEAFPDTLANVALFFSGSPVFGTHSIDAAFASDALGKYQDIVSRQFASRSEEGLLGDRGRVPLKELSALQIHGVVHGSFGFLLEERGSDQLTFVPTALRETLDEVTRAIEAFGMGTDEQYVQTIESMNRRVFAAVKDFYEVLHNAGATLRIVEGDKDDTFGPESISRGYDRSQRTNIEEREEKLSGILLGILPNTMQFEFQPDGRDVISGKTGPSISQSYLERIHADEKVVGSRCVAKVLTKTTVRPTGQVTTKYVLIDLSVP
ncbi:MAG: hypothetical protein KF889_03865 [Alphaproteobacteria bacterium]|nr:hypothetical protein [Alphaproteobacteria bacterium]MCW5744513.1 hypothetical protein [Alphaproteobacteria bacterium]